MPRFSSGDLLADRRYGYAEAAARERDDAAAADLFAQAVERVPDWVPAWFGLGRAKLRLFEAGGDEAMRREAVSALARALELDPDDRLGARLHLARLGGDIGGAIGGVMSSAYVAALFDDYAPRFDTHLVRALAYRAPEILRAALDRVFAATDRRFPVGRMIDLGCGTGLVAACFRDRAVHIAGIDLSEQMIAVARGKALYDRLRVGEAVAALADEAAGGADLIVAADVFVYIGDLADVLAAACRALRSGGVLAFTVQDHDGGGFLLGDDLRYAHSASYLRAAVAHAGLAIAHLEPAVTRKDAGADVPGLVVAAVAP